MPLPDISLRKNAPTSSKRISSQRMSPPPIYPADLVSLFLATLAYRPAVQDAVINLAGRQGLLAYATGEHLEHLGALLGVERLTAKNGTHHTPLFSAGIAKLLRYRAFRQPCYHLRRFRGVQNDVRHHRARGTV